jgi:hypothetical protein
MRNSPEAPSGFLTARPDAVRFAGERMMAPKRSRFVYCHFSRKLTPVFDSDKKQELTARRRRKCAQNGALGAACTGNSVFDVHAA